MTWAAFLLVLVYAALKGGKLAFTGKTSGYRSEPLGLWERLRAGEPALLIAAALLTVPPVLAAQWYHTYKFRAVLQDSLTCYALVAVYRDAPEIMRSNGEHAVYLSFNGYRANALDAASQLGLTARASQDRLTDVMAAAIAERARAGKTLQRARLAETHRCLHPPIESPNA